MMEQNPTPGLLPYRLSYLTESVSAPNKISKIRPIKKGMCTHSLSLSQLRRKNLHLLQEQIAHMYKKGRLSFRLCLVQSWH